ncbi:MAG: PAS domain-containing protein, partial [Sciscionella sp.]
MTTSAAVTTSAATTAAIPDAPALICRPDGVVAGANAAAVVLAGAPSQERLCGMPLDELLLGGAPELRLHRLDGCDVPVRVVRWPVPGTADEAVLLLDISDMVTAAEVLRDEQRRLNQVQRVARMGSWEHDCATGVTVWSPSHYELLGLEPDSRPAGAQTLLEYVHPADRAMVGKQLRHRCGTAVSSGQVELFDNEFRIVRADGEIRRMYGLAELRPPADGRSTRVTGYTRDITESWLVRAQLDAERARLLEAQRIARIGSWSFEGVAGTVHRSEVLLELYAANGVAPDDDILCNVHPEDQPAAKELRHRLLHGETGPLELEVRGAKGGRIYATRSRAERTADGQLLRLHGTMQDVTEQRMLERQLADDRRRLADAQRAARLGTWEWDPETGDCVWSDMLYQLAGAEPGAAVTFNSFLRRVHPDDRGWLDDYLRRTVVEQGPVECEFRAVRADGLPRIFRCRGGSMRDSSGRTLFVGTAQDVTEQRATESRMRRSSQRFTDLVSLVPVGIGLFDESERLVDANAALCELLGMDLERLRGLDARALTHPDDGPRQPLSGGASQDARQRVLRTSDGA